MARDIPGDPDRLSRAAQEALERLRALAYHRDEDDDDEFWRTATEKRIDMIVGLMVNGSFVPGVTHRKLATEWNLGVRRIEQLVDEASRVVRRYIRDDAEGRKLTAARVVQSIERIGQKAETSQSKTGLRDALFAYKTLAEIHGLIRQTVDLNDERRSRFEGWTREEKERFAATGERPERFVDGGAGRGRDG